MFITVLVGSPAEAAAGIAVGPSLPQLFLKSLSGMSPRAHRAGSTTCWEPRSCQARPPASASRRRALASLLALDGLLCVCVLPGRLPTVRATPGMGRTDVPRTAQPDGFSDRLHRVCNLPRCRASSPTAPWSLPQRGLGIRPCVCPAVAWTASYSRGTKWHLAGPSPDLRGCPRAGATLRREPLPATDTTGSPVANMSVPGTGVAMVFVAAIVRASSERQGLGQLPCGPAAGSGLTAHFPLMKTSGAKSKPTPISRAGYGGTEGPWVLR